MKHALYEHPITHKFALIRLPEQFADGDAVPDPARQTTGSAIENRRSRHCPSCSMRMNHRVSDERDV